MLSRSGLAILSHPRGSLIIENLLRKWDRSAEFLEVALLVGVTDVIFLQTFLGSVSLDHAIPSNVGSPLLQNLLQTGCSNLSR